MNRVSITAICALIVLLAVDVQAQKPTVVIGSGIKSGRVRYDMPARDGANVFKLDKDTIYILTGAFTINSGDSLVVEAGTTILGDSAATVVVQPGGRIHAVGTQAEPIIFTSARPVGQRAPGDWGGIVILGNASTNYYARANQDPTIEGGILPGTYGNGPLAGIDNQRSGALKYVRIEFPGFRFQPANEVNGLTMGGVGNGTELDYVQVSHSFDDSFEWFGGTVTAKHLVAYSGYDDDFDMDFGFQGKLQFLFGMRDRNVFDPTTDTRGFEIDNGDDPDYFQPFTEPLISNATLIGPYRNAAELTAGPPTGSIWAQSAELRTGSRPHIHNTLIAGYPKGVRFRAHPTHTSVTADSLVFENNLIRAAVGNRVDIKDVLNTTLYTVPYFETWVDATARANDVAIETSTTYKGKYWTDVDALTAPNMVIPGLSPLIGAADFTNLTDPFFTSVSYAGAFDDTKNQTNLWINGWTNFDPQNTNYFNGTLSLLSSGWNMVSVPRYVTTDSTVATLFPGISGPAYSFDGTTYVSNASTVQATVGYWVFMTGNAVQQTEGNEVGTVSLSANPGEWILLPATNKVLKDNDANGLPDGMTVTGGTISGNTIYGYDGTRYVVLKEMLPGQCYWAFITGAGGAGSVTIAY
jgi:hypothetical protein